MTYLLDTHTLIWTLFDPDKLSHKVRAIIESRKHPVFVSAVSFWEISLKFGLGKIDLPKTSPDELPQAVRETGFSIAELSPDLLASYHQLKPHPKHKDPFDRLLIWQAIQARHCLLSKDKKMDLYAGQSLQTIW